MFTSSALARKTQHLKWLKQLKAEKVKSVVLDETEQTDCNCRAWLKKQAKKHSKIKKPVKQEKLFPLTLVGQAPPKNGRNSQYNLSFEQGTAGWYHLPAKVLATDYDDFIVPMIQFVALGITSMQSPERQVKYCWPVLSVQSLPRHMLTVAQSGSLKASDEMYWLFELGEAEALPHAVTGFPHYFSVKLTSKEELVSKSHFDKLAKIRY